MNLLKPFTMTWWQVGLFKWSLVSLGIVLGATWPELLAPWRGFFLILFVLPTLYISWLWLKR